MDKTTFKVYSKKNAAILGHLKTNIRKSVDDLEEAHLRMIRGEPTGNPLARMALTEGPDWYYRAVAQLPRQHQIRLCWVVATLSPGMRWEDNIDEAVRLMDAPLEAIEHMPWKAYATNVRKCVEYRQTLAPDIPTGPKVSAFFYSLVNATRIDLNLTSEHLMCVDRWMIRLATGKWKAVVNPEIVKRAYIEVYEDCPWCQGYFNDISEYQATLWIYAREDV
jgi:hypothetical protein